MTEMDFRTQLDQVKTAAGVADAEFALVGLRRYEAVLLEIIERLTTLKQGGLDELWWWNSFEEPKSYGPSVQPSARQCCSSSYRGMRQSGSLPKTGVVRKKHGSFWLYEGRIDAITAVLDEAWAFEFYLVSKKFEWLLCYNHHDVLMAVGEPTVTKLRRLTE
jgi:hypothetical protein